MRKALDDDLVMSLVELVLRHPPETREAWLRTASAGNPDLFNQVWDYVQWNHRMQNFLLEPLCPGLQARLVPAAKDHRFSQGDLLSGRFRIVREIAEGGMGIVYEAYDERLGRRIALKCARSGFLQRLPPEVRHASEISHPNVCRIFEIHTASTPHGEIDFFTMEFVDGDTLRVRLKAGPLPDAEALTIGRQICAGVAEAHRNGVVHGDLKSNNVILSRDATGNVRAVVTDFGLARGPLGAAETTAQGITGASQAGGTPGYMAPELWQGEKPTLASDVYALGVTLYELLANRLPYPAERAPQERREQPPPALNHAWNPVLQRCLDADPARRYRDAGEVAAALEPPLWKRWWMPAVAALFLAAAISGTITWQRATAPAESIHLAMLPLQAGPGDGAVAENISRDAAAQLARLTGGKRARLSFAPVANPDTTNVLHGTLTRESGKVIVDAFLTDAHTHAAVVERTFEYSPADLRFAATAMAGMVTARLGLTPPPGRPVNEFARQDYSAGLNDLRRWDRVDSALAALERAAAADPDSPLTHAALAEAEWLKYAFTGDETWLHRTENSVQAAESRNPDVAEVHAVAGLLLGYDRAIAEYRRATELNPAYGDAWRRLGAAYQSNGQIDEAVAALQKAVEVQPDFYKPWQSLGAFYQHRGNHEEAAKAFLKMVALAPDLAASHQMLAQSERDLGQLSQAEKELRQAIALKDSGVLELDLGFVLMLEGRDEEAIACYRRALASAPWTDIVWLNLGISYARSGQSAEATQAFRQSLDLTEKKNLQRDPRDGTSRARTAYIYARLRDKDRALDQIAEALQFSPNDRDTRAWAIETYEILGLRDQALNILSASPGNMVRGMLEELIHFPGMADLIRDSRFTGMLASYRVQ